MRGLALGDSAAATETRRGKASPPSAVGWAWPRAGLGERIGQACVVVALAAALAVGFALTPSRTGAGTHTVLGLPECGMLKATGKPCPTCGVTTAFVLASHGHLVEAFVAQPFGFLLFILAAGGMVFSVATLVAGRSWAPLAVWVNPVVVLLALLLVMLISWAYKWSVM